MAGKTVFSMMLVTVTILAQLSVASVVSSNAAANTNCSSLTTYDACSPHLHCSWCGEVTSSNGLCFDRAAGLTCCETKNASSYFCNPAPQLCTSEETCYHESDDTSYGLCDVPVCCGQGKPQPCGSTCIAADAICCEQGLSCSSDQSCCGGEYVGFACCEKDGSCCSAPDGYAHWCCPAGQTCDINGGCDA